MERATREEGQSGPAYWRSCTSKQQQQQQVKVRVLTPHPAGRRPKTSGRKDNNNKWQAITQEFNRAKKQIRHLTETLNVQRLWCGRKRGGCDGGARGVGVVVGGWVGGGESDSGYVRRRPRATEV